MQYRLGLGSPQLRLGGQVVFGPIGHGIEHFTKGFAAGREAVLYAWRGFAVGFAINHAAAFKFFEPDGQRAGTNTTDIIHKFRKPAVRVFGKPAEQDKGGPVVYQPADHIHGASMFRYFHMESITDSISAVKLLQIAIIAMLRLPHFYLTVYAKKRIHAANVS